MAAVASGEKKDTLYVNVINMIDILIILLVFLLTNFATSTFEDTTSLPAGMPIIGGNDPPPGPRPGIKQLEVRMEQAQGFTVVVSFEDREPRVIDVKPRSGGFDFERLSDELLKIKQAYDTRKDVLLEADKKLAFDEIVKAMDACREKVVKGGGQVMRYPLFPAVALTDLP